VEAARRSIRKLAFKTHEITVERHREFGAGRGLFLRRWPEFKAVPARPAATTARATAAALFGAAAKDTQPADPRRVVPGRAL
jgi:hypothetical protein